MMQEGREVVKKKAFVPPPRFMNIDEARYRLYVSVAMQFLHYVCMV